MRLDKFGVGFCKQTLPRKVNKFGVGFCKNHTPEKRKRENTTILCDRKGLHEKCGA